MNQKFETAIGQTRNPARLRHSGGVQTGYGGIPVWTVRRLTDCIFFAAFFKTVDKTE
jgi:hypothetical protein